MRRRPARPGPGDGQCRFEFRDELRGVADFDEVSIGGHSKLEVVYVVGKVKASEAFAELLN